MGHNTTYLGHVEIVPGLNQAEYDYLRAFTYSRRCYRRDGPYAVIPAHPHEGESQRATKLRNQIADGQPGYWCDWAPCPHGCCLKWNGFEKFSAGGAWLQYLIDHFLRRGAHAARSGDPQFEQFAFDHEMNGFVVGERHDTRELFALIVQEDEVQRVVLRDGDPGAPWEPGYQEIDDLPWLAHGPKPWLDAGDFVPMADTLSPPKPAGQRSTRPRPAAKKSAKLRSVSE